MSKPQRFEISQEITPKHGRFMRPDPDILPPPKFGEIVRVRSYYQKYDHILGWLISLFERPDNYLYPEDCFDPVNSINEVMELLKEEPEHV